MEKVGRERRAIRAIALLPGAWSRVRRQPVNRVCVGKDYSVSQLSELARQRLLSDSGQVVIAPVARDAGRGLPPLGQLDAGRPHHPDRVK